MYSGRPHSNNSTDYFQSQSKNIKIENEKSQENPLENQKLINKI